MSLKPVHPTIDAGSSEASPVNSATSPLTIPSVESSGKTAREIELEEENEQLKSQITQLQTQVTALQAEMAKFSAMMQKVLDNSMQAAATEKHARDQPSPQQLPNANETSSPERKRQDAKSTPQKPPRPDASPTHRIPENPAYHAEDDLATTQRNLGDKFEDAKQDLDDINKGPGDARSNGEAMQP